MGTENRYLMSIFCFLMDHKSRCYFASFSLPHFVLASNFFKINTCADVRATCTELRIARLHALLALLARTAKFVSKMGPW
jgi:hypothetical protein